MRETNIVPLVGSSMMRVEGQSKTEGKTRYIDDYVRPGMWHGATVRSRQARGRIKSIEFVGPIPWHEFVVVTAKDLPGPNTVAFILQDQPVLAEHTFAHVGEPIVLIAHPDRELVHYAKQFVHVEVEALPPVLSIEESLAKKSVIWGHDNVFKAITIRKGTPATAWESADLITEGTYVTGAQEQLYIEPQGMIAEVADDSSQVTVWGSLQCPYYVSKALQVLFALPQEQIRVVQAETGGGFGGKEEYPSILACHAALLAQKAKVPVKMIYDREEDLSATTKRHPSRTHIKSAFTKDGKLCALHIQFLLDGGAYATLSSVVLSRGAIHAAGPYHCEHVLIEAKALATNHPPRGAFRGFGAPQSCFALERHLDRVATQLDIDPAELRRRNFLHSDSTTATGQTLREEVPLPQLLSLALEKTEYKKKRQYFAQERNADPYLRRGIGLSTFFHGAGFTGSGEAYLGSKVQVAFAGGKIRILTSNTEIGQGTYTVFTQIAADSLKICPKLIEVVRPDTSIVPNSGPTVASRTVMVVGKLVHQACLSLVARLQAEGLPADYSEAGFLAQCSKLIESSGPVCSEAVYKQADYITWDDQTYQGDAYGTFAWACYVAEVEVDLRTFETQVTSFTALQEVGKVMHPVLAEGQIEGGVLQGVGFALYERVLEQDGVLRNANLTNYIIPTSSDAPAIKVHFLEHATPFGPYGAKGIGELPLDGSAVAVINALAHAVGNDPTSIPFMPEDLMHSMAPLETTGGRRA